MGKFNDIHNITGELKKFLGETKADKKLSDDQKSQLAKLAKEKANDAIIKLTTKGKVELPGFLSKDEVAKIVNAKEEETIANINKENEKEGSTEAKSLFDNLRASKEE